MADESNLKEKDLKSEDFDVLDAESVEQLKIDVYRTNLGLKYIFDGFKERKKEYAGQWLVGPSIFTLILVSGFFLVTFIEGTWHLENGVFQDIEKFIVIYLSLFLMLIFLRIFYKKLNIAFYDLCKNDIIDESKFSFNKFKALTHESEKLISGNDRKYRYKHIINNKHGIGFKGLRGLQIIAIIIIVYDSIKFIYFNEFPDDAWMTDAHLGIFYYSRIEYLLIFAYLLPTVLWHFTATIYCMRKIITELSCADAFKLRPIAPDGVAGLKPLGELSLGMIYFIAAPMIIIIPYLLTEFDSFHIDGGLLLISYFFLATMIFFFPLGTTHSIMREAKEKELHKLSIEFNKAYEKYSNFNSESTEVTKDMELTVEYMERIGSLHNHVSKMAVWPFDMSIVLKFILTIAIPFLVVLFDTFVLS